MLQIEKLNFQYENNPVFIDFNLKLEPGQTIVLTGPNGSGKTSLTKIIRGICSEQAGQIFIHHQPRTPAERMQNREIGYLNSTVQQWWPHLTVKENFICFLSSRGLDREKIRQKWEFFQKHFQMQDFSHRYISLCSNGEKQILKLSMYFAQEKRTFHILDEPMAYLDPSRRCAFYEILENEIQEKEGAVVLTLQQHEIRDQDRSKVYQLK